MNFSKIDEQVDIWIEEAQDRVLRKIKWNPIIWSWYLKQYGVSFINSNEEKHYE